MSDKVIPDTDVTIVEESDGHFSVRADSAELGGDEVPAMPGSSSNETGGVDSWRQASSSRPVEVVVQGEAYTDGASDAKVSLLVDEDGGSTADFTFTVAHAPSDLTDGTSDEGSLSLTIPVGAQYQVDATSNNDPDDTDNSATVYEYVK